MLMALVCVCQACGDRAYWLSLEQANEWAQSHWQPMVVGRITVYGPVMHFLSADTP